MPKSSVLITQHVSSPAHFRTFELAVEGERPAQHAHRVEALLANAPGIQKVEAHLKDERVLVTYDSSLTNLPAIHDHLLTHGYKAARRAD